MLPSYFQATQQRESRLTTGNLERSGGNASCSRLWGSLISTRTNAKRGPKGGI